MELKRASASVSKDIILSLNSPSIQFDLSSQKSLNVGASGTGEDTVMSKTDMAQSLCSPLPQGQGRKKGNKQVNQQVILKVQSEMNKVRQRYL